ncbi:MAG: hypothetical protein K6F73_05545 [Lachnospiraceae bacterium]|nr:hypothetical protein [Lachnospiraceae bacterium]
MRVAVLGRTKILFNSIEAVRAAGHDVVLIGTCAAADEYDVRERDFENKAKEIGAVFFNNPAINSPEIVQIMKQAGADAAISLNWLTIIRGEAISCFPYGILNAHCGDLPRYRGNACPNWAILSGEKEYAISVHYMEPGELDSGDILIKKKYPINDDTYISEIYENMRNEIPGLFCEALSMIESGKGKGSAQSKNPADSLRCYPRIPSDSFLNWNEPCEALIRNIRASSHPFSGAYCFCEGMKLYIFEASARDFPAPCHVNPGQVIAFDRQEGWAEIAASDGIVRVERITVDGQEYLAAEILKSTRIRLNYSLDDEIYRLRQEISALRKEIDAISEKA